MKKLILCAALAVFGFTNVNAQEEGAASQGFSFGPKAGVNFATLTGDIEDAEMKLGFHIGGAAEYMFNENMGLQAELLFSTQGAKNEYTESGNVGGNEFYYKEEEKVKLSYINIPVMFKYYIVNGFNVEVGPQVGILASAKAEFEYEERTTIGGSTTTESGSAEVDIDDEVSSVDFGLNFGLGYKMDNGLNFGARYNLGLSNVNDADDSDDFKISNGVIQVSVGFMF
ncbi:porin family protein [Hanstruepera ponticola]|uniref:porin family protein n=1 Tax=Hanstruepera ponticola TaxID=2042995 RepID=UPI000CF051B1|nr:porin family protein [Hanstruepera ponticola]